MEGIEQKYENASIILEDIWVNIDWENMNNSRKRGITDEFTSKIRAFSRCFTNLEKFINKICKSFNSNISKKETLELLKNNDEIMEIYREETQIPVLLMQIRREEIKAKSEERKNNNLSLKI